MQDKQDYQFHAFITFSAEDSKAVRKFYSKLEFYRVPNRIREMIKNSTGKETPQYIHPLFLDSQDVELPESLITPSLQSLLEDSKFLIVICSPNSAKSEWVNQIIENFILMGRYERIIPYIIDGIPDSGDPATECFPPILRGNREFISYSFMSPEENEKRHAELHALLDGNVIEWKGISLPGVGEKISRLQLIACLLEITPEMASKYNIIEIMRQRRRKKIFCLAITALSFIILIVCLGLWIWYR